MNPAPKKNCTVKEAASLLGVSTNTLYKYLDEGKIRSRRIGRGRFKIPYTELQPFLNENPVLIPSQAVQVVPPVDEAPTPILEQKSVNSLLPIQPTESAPIVKNTPIPVDETKVVKFGVNDILIFRMFKTLILLGLGLIYILTSSSNLALTTAFDSGIHGLLMAVLPYGLILAGFMNLLEVLFPGKKIVNHLVIDLFVSLVTGYYSYSSLITGNYGLFVFTMALCGTAIDHLISDVKSSSQNHSFMNSFAKYSLFLAVLGGIFVSILPTLFPISSAVKLIENYREIFGFLWFLLLFVPAAYLISPAGDKSLLRVPYFTLASFLALVIGVKSMLIPNWDIAFFSLITGVFGIFLAWWVESEVVFDIKRFKFLLFSFLWVFIVVIVSFLTLESYGHKANQKVTDQVQSSLNDVSAKIRVSLNRRSSVLISYSGKEAVIESVKNGDTEAAISQAKEIYEGIGNLNRVLIYNHEGVAVGVYPRDTLTQNTNFSSREYFQKTIQAKKGYITDKFQSILQTTTVMQTEPIFEGNQIIGVIGIATSPENFINTFQLNDAPFVVSLLDSKGEKIFETKKEAETKDINIYTLTEVKSSEVTLTRELDYPRWKINIQSFSELAHEELSGLATSLTVIIVLNSLFSIIAGVLVSQKREIVQPIKQEFLQSPKFIATNWK